VDVVKRETVLSTPWFKLIARWLDEPSAEPYYALEMSDYVSVLAFDEAGNALLVRQYRPALERFSVELPSGHVEDGETPEGAARRELREETGHEAGSLELLGCLSPDTGRLSNRLWCFLAPTAVRVGNPTEDGVELLTCVPDQLVAKILSAELDHALNIAAIALAMLRGKTLTQRPTSS